MQEKSFILIIGAIALVVVLGLSSFSYYQKLGFEKDFAKLNFEYENLVNQVSESGYADTVNLFSAKKVLDKIDSETLKWSTVIKEVVKTVPKDEKGNPKLDVVAYSGSGGSGITLNVSTIPASTNAFSDVADFIKAFDSSSKFSENFVPSIASGVNAEGKSILSFSFSTVFSDELSLISR